MLDFCIEARFADGSEGIIDLKQPVFSLPGLAPLRDPTAFAGAVLGEYGWEIEWPDFDIQIGADTLFTDLLEQNAKNPADRFTLWRIRNGLSLAAASRELGITVRTISAYGSGARPIPRTVELACLGWEQEQKLRALETVRSAADHIEEAIRVALAEDSEDVAAFKERVNEASLTYQALVKELKEKDRI